MTKPFYFFVFIGLCFLISCDSNVKSTTKSIPTSDKDKVIVTPKKVTLNSKPLLAECNAVGDERAQKKCTDEKLKQLLEENAIYPESAKVENRKGSVQLKATIGVDGQIKEFSFFKKMGFDDLNKEAMRVANIIKEKNLKWAPAKDINNNLVESYYVFPQIYFPKRRKLSIEEQEALNKLKELGSD